MPSNHNVILPNKSSKYIKVFTKNGWQNKDKREFIDMLIEHYYVQINLFHILNENCLTNPFHINNYENFKNRYEQKDTNLFEILRKDIELMFLNHSVCKPLCSHI